MIQYTLDDLEKARRELKIWEDKWERYNGNNPNKYSSEFNLARVKLDEIEAALKASGQLPITDQEKLQSELDRLFPHAKSKDVVELRSKKYRLKFWPCRWSRSGRNVTEWGKTWQEVPVETPVTVTIADRAPEQPQNKKLWAGNVKLVITNKRHVCPACNAEIAAKTEALCLDGYRFILERDWGNLVYAFWLCSDCGQKLSGEKNLKSLVRGQIVFWEGDLCKLLGITNPATL